MIDNIKKGDKLFLIHYKHNKSSYHECKVIKVGRKYITIEYGGNFKKNVQFYKDNLKEKSEYAQQYFLYKSEEEYMKKLERDDYLEIFRKVFGKYCHVKEEISLEKLKEAAKILGFDRDILKTL